PTGRWGQNLPRHRSFLARDWFQKGRWRQSGWVVESVILRHLGLGVPGECKAMQTSEQIISLRIFRVGFDVSGGVTDQTVHRNADCRIHLDDPFEGAR